MKVRSVIRCLRISRTVTILGALLLASGAGVTAAQDKDAPGITKSEIRIGQTMPYSGPASALSAVGKVQERYFRMLNDQGGINGRKIKFISTDDGYNPAKAVEQTRKLVEHEQVAFMFASMGTGSNAAVQKYLNANKVPQLFAFAGSSRFADPRTYPWTISGLTLFDTEGGIYARHVARERPNAKVAVLYQNDDFGKEYLAGFKARLKELAPAAQIVATASYEATSPSIDSQIIALAGSGADVFLNASTPKFTAQAIRKAHDIGWKPMQFLSIGSNFIATVLKPAGLDKAIGVISATPTKSVGDPEWENDPDYKEWVGFMKKYYPEGDLNEQLNLTGYNIAVLMTKVLKNCGDDLSRANIMKQTANLQNVKLPGLIPGITVNTSPSDYRFIKQLRLQRFDGTRWMPFGEILNAN
jgi:ABC-type branched-subunit amino acid transport system substrate-binding protein